MGSNFAWMLILAKYLGLSRRFSKFGSGAEIWGTPRGAPPRPKNLNFFFFQNLDFFEDMVSTMSILKEMSKCKLYFLYF